MAFIRKCFVMAVCVFGMLCTKAQTVSYPLLSSQLLKSTAEDAATLLQKAITGSHFTLQSYSTMPSTGIIFIYDSSITDNQACRVESDGTHFIKFSAAQDNGLCFGIYQYLQDLGFRFYQPGSIWEMIPSINTAFRKSDTVYTSDFKYNSWFISGGHNTWAMDKNASYGWDSYFGENGHNWALYQRRNGMTGAYRFAGHREDIMTGNYLATLQNNPCYVANNNNSRAATSQSVPDVNNAEAMKLWANAIEQKYLQYRNVIYGNVSLYVNQFRNFNYSYKNIGIEVPDGAKWGNTTDNQGCNGGIGYSKESDQQFTLANYTAKKIKINNPNSRFQLYAYSAHADIPSENILLDESLDIQLVPAVYQNISSTNGLRNRWYNRTRNISEYNYLNLSGWSGETPAFYLDDFKNTVQIAQDKKSQGLLWEASPAKFGSLPFLLAATRNLKDNISIDNTLKEFCDNMFAGAAKTVYDLLQFWTDSKNLAGGTSNRYKIPVYLDMIVTAEQQIKNEPVVVKERLRELKAYLHYMIMYYEWAGDQRTDEAKADKAAALCIYLAKINKLQLVNSYYIIAFIAGKYANTSSFYQQYNRVNGTAYQNGNLPLITAAEIDNSFINDKAVYSNIINAYKFETASFIKDQFNSAGLDPLKKINVQLNYTNGLDYYNRTEFFIQAPAAGSFTIDYTPKFDMPDKGYINFIVESAEKALEIIKDFSIDRTSGAGVLSIKLPSAGIYKFTVVSKYKSSVKLDITTNNNFFYKSGAFFGKATEIYQNNSGMPGYFYIPKNINKLYFSVGNSNASGAGFASAETINNAFALKDNNDKTLTARFVTPTDSALFYIDIPEGSKGKFCQVSKMGAYSLVFSNISNYVWYAQLKPAPCSNANFTISVINKNGNCITQLTAAAKTGNLEWEVNDLGKTYTFSNQSVVELPDYSSPNAVVTLTNGINCSVTKRIGDDTKFLKAKETCASGGTLPSARNSAPVLYPNPSSGIFKCLQNGESLTANEIIISNAQGARIGNFKNENQFNIGNSPAGLYWYKLVVNGKEFTGKLIKL